MREIFEALENNGDRTIRDWAHYRAREAQIDRKIHMLQSAEVNLQTGKVGLPQDLLAVVVKDVVH